MTSGSICAILSFVGFFLKKPQPIMQLAAACDLLHFATTLYQMRIMMFGARDLIYPEYLWLMLVKLALAIWLFFEPGDPMVALRYGVTLCAFSYQRLFIFFFRAIYKNEEHYVLATTLCGVMGGYQAIGCFWATVSLILVMTFYRFVLKGTWLAGDDLEVGDSADRSLNLFKQASMLHVKMGVLDMHGKEGISRLKGSNRKDPAHAAEQRELAMLVTYLMSDNPHKQPRDGNCKVGRVDGLMNILFRFGFSPDQVEGMVKSFGFELPGCACGDADAVRLTFDVSHVERNSALAEFLTLLSDELVEQLAEDNFQTPTGSTSLPTHQQVRRYSVAEVSLHNSAASLWLVIAGKVYDLTEFARRHPGGPDVLLRLAGGDATEKWTKKHGNSQLVHDMMISLCIGSVDPSCVTSHVQVVPLPIE